MRRQISRRSGIRRGLRNLRARLARSVRLLVMLALSAAVLFSIGSVIAKVAKPYRLSYRESREIAKIERQIAEAKAENIRLKHDIAHISTPEGKEEEARKLGWVKKGEIALVIERPGQAEARSTLPSAASESLWHSTILRIMGLFARAEPDQR